MKSRRWSAECRRGPSRLPGPAPNPVALNQLPAGLPGCGTLRTFFPFAEMTTHSLRLAVLAATLTMGALAAQATPYQTTPRGGRGANMLQDLNLTAEQQTQVEALMKDAMAQRGTRPSGPPTDAERQAMQTRRAEMDTKLKAILTPEQYAKYQAMRSQRGPRDGSQAPAN